MSGEILNDLVYRVPIEIPQRENPFCVICKNAIIVTDVNGKEHKLHCIETNSSWGANPYGEEYAVVPDSMVTEIMATSGFCDIVLNADGTEVVSFTALPIPEFSEEEPTPSIEDRIAELEEQLALQDELSIELFENQIAQEETNAAQDEALIELFEMVGGE